MSRRAETDRENRSVLYKTELKNQIKPKSKNKRNTVLMMSLMLLLFITYITGYAITYYSRPKIAEVRITLGSAANPDVFNGLIIRDETTYTANASGVLYMNTADSERVRKNDVVCSIQDAGEVAQIEKNLSALDEQIYHVQENRDSIFSSDIEELNRQIKTAVDSSALKIKKDISSVYALKSKLQQTLDLRNQLLLNEDSLTVSKYLSQKYAYQNQLSSAIQSIRASEGGIVSYTLDGLEDSLTVSRMLNFQRDQFLGKIDEQPLSHKREITAGEAVCKVITSNVWYISAFLPSTKTETLKTGDSLMLFVQQDDEDSVPLDVTVFHLDETSDGTIHAVFRATRLMTDFLHKRQIAFALEAKMPEGFKIPDSAIAERLVLKLPRTFVTKADDKYLVEKTTPSGLVSVSITIIGSDSTHYFTVQNYSFLKHGDEIVSPSGEHLVLNEIRDAAGVYVTNTGTAVFKEITITNPSVNGYTVLEPSLNSALKIQDKIVSDVRNISDSQLIY